MGGVHSLGHKKSRILKSNTHYAFFVPKHSIEILVKFWNNYRNAFVDRECLAVQEHFGSVHATFDTALSTKRFLATATNNILEHSSYSPDVARVTF
jgi:hypothetical protein